MLGVIVVLLAVGAGAGGAPSSSSDNADHEFERLLAAAQDDPARADFAALRRAFVRTPAYRRGAADDDWNTQPVDQELANGETVAAMLALDRILRGHWMDVEAHLYASAVCARLGEDARADRHAAFARGLLRAIIEAGDGGSFATAWPVIDVREEPLVLRAARIGDPRDRRRVERDGRTFDILTVPGPAGGEAVRVYFRIVEPGDGSPPSRPGGHEDRP